MLRCLPITANGPTLAFVALVGCFSPAPPPDAAPPVPLTGAAPTDASTGVAATPNPKERQGPEPVRALDSSTGGPLKRVNVTSVRMTEDVIDLSSEDLAGHVVQCDASFGSPVGTSWYTFSDDECFLGISSSALQLLHNGRDGLGCTVRWLGALRPKVTDPFAGIGQDITRADLTAFRTILLEVRGDGRRYRAQITLAEQLRQGALARTEQPRDAEGQRDCHEEWYDYYGQTFVCGDGTDVWTPLEVDLTTLRQSGFGKVLPLRLEDAHSFQVVTVDHDAHDFQCELRVVGLR